MFKLFSKLALVGAFLSLPCLGITQPQAPLPRVTYVSGKGIDTGTCAAPTNPCRTFQFAINRTSPAGEVKALDPAHYGGVLITKSISITGIEGVGIDPTTGDAIAINAGPSDKINLAHLTVDGIGMANNGIVLNSGGSLTIMHCVVRNFLDRGIRLQPSGAAKFLIGDTLVSGNSVGIGVNPATTGAARGTLDGVLMNDNYTGIFVSGIATSAVADVTAVDSKATNNEVAGFDVGIAGVLRLAHSAATGNGVGVSMVSPGRVESFGDNYIHGNTLDVDGTLTHVATQ